jgi:hypothetical protein
MGKRLETRGEYPLFLRRLRHFAGQRKMGEQRWASDCSELASLHTLQRPNELRQPRLRHNDPLRPSQEV